MSSRERIEAILMSKGQPEKDFDGVNYRVSIVVLGTTYTAVSMDELTALAELAAKVKDLPGSA